MKERLTSAERQRRHRERLKERKDVVIPVTLSIGGKEHLDKMMGHFEGDKGTMAEFAERALLVGATFLANSGGGRTLHHCPRELLRGNGKDG